MAINKLVVIGFGLIGASVAAGLKAVGACHEVLAIARSQRTRDRAVEWGLADRSCERIDEIAAELSGGDLICIAVPTLSMEAVFKAIAEYVNAEVTITDCASVKGSVLTAAQNVFGSVPPQLVLGHPIAGSEKSGVEAANPHLYRHHRVILTPLDSTGAEHLHRVRDMWQCLGAEILEMPVAEHDAILAATSHLPHVIAYSLVDTLAHDAENENIFRYAAGGFKDFTRIASSDPIMWHDIMLANRDSVLDALALFSNNLEHLRAAIKRGDSDYLLGVFTRAKAARDHFVTRLGKQMYTKRPTTAIDYVIQPGGHLRGELRVPGDKSISHRAVMLGSLAEGTTQVEGFLEGEDALATLQAFRDMGVVIEGPEQGRLKIHGVGMGGLQAPPGPLYLGNSGTSMRLLAGLMVGQTFATVLTGDESVSRRPMQRIAKPLNKMGAKVNTAPDGCPPLEIRGGVKLHGIDYKMPMASAQVKSSVLLAGLYASGTTSVRESAITRDHTERMLRGFGYAVNSEGGTVSLEGGGGLKATHIEVPADISSAAFFLVAASICPGAELTLTHVGVNPTRIGVLTILRLMGADIGFSNKRDVGGEPVADIHVRHAPLKGIDIPPELVPLAIDEFPALFIAAACAEGTTRLREGEELRVKESDRIQVMAEGLQILGVNATPTSDGMLIEGGDIGGGAVNSHGDHRIAMAFAIAAVRAAAPIQVKNCANVATSFPDFVHLANQVGISIEEIAS